MPKPGYKTVTIKEESLRVLEEIGKQIHKSVPETIDELARLFSRYTKFLKALEGSSPPSSADLISLIETLKIQSEQESIKAMRGP